MSYFVPVLFDLLSPATPLRQNTDLLDFEFGGLDNRQSLSMMHNGHGSDRDDDLVRLQSRQVLSYETNHRSHNATDSYRSLSDFKTCSRSS
jgi:hypothetical protein